MIILSSYQKRTLRALGHHLDPIVLVGHQGVTEAVCSKTRRELEAHELLKVRVIDTAPDDAKATAAALSEQVDAALVQVIGHTFLIYRPNPEEPKIVLAPAQRTAKGTSAAKSASISSGGKGGAKR